MKVVNVPSNINITYRSTYNQSSNGIHMEELIHESIIKKYKDVQTDLIYLPIYWTSYYVKNNYGKDTVSLDNFLNTLDKTKRYFTVTQYGCGIINVTIDFDLFVFSAGGGGLQKLYYTDRRVFDGNPANDEIPLLYTPSVVLICASANLLPRTADIY